MNGLTLRINNKGGKKNKNVSGFATVDVSKFIPENIVSENSISGEFVNAKTADEQLQLLKKKLTEENVSESSETITFLVKIFFNTEAKHPVKCFLARHITKNLSLHQAFSEALSQELKSSTSVPHTSYKDYISTVTKMAACIENFPPGSEAIKMEEMSLSQYLDASVKCCVETLKSQSLSPTEKNEIYGLAHLSLRLLLHIIQKMPSENIQQLENVIISIKLGIQELLFDADVPMDTKSVCGILFLTVYMLEKGTDSWIDIVNSTPKDCQLSTLLSNEASQLSLYSAIPTLTAMDELQSQSVDGEIALVVLCQKILDIGERSCSESVFTLGVTRTVVQISKQLNKLKDSEIGLRLVKKLLQFVWGHLEHYMDSVRHLTAQMLSNIVKFCSDLDRNGNPEALTSVFESLTSLDRTRKGYFISLTALTNELGAKEVLKRSKESPAQLILALNQQAVQASATSTLETLLQKHSHESNTQEIYDQWIMPVSELVSSSSCISELVSSKALDSSVINILENLLAKAIKLDESLIEFIKPHIGQSNTSKKFVLMLLSAVRKSGATCRLDCAHDAQLWKGIIAFKRLESAAVSTEEETRILSLSLIVESPKTTETFTEGELDFIQKFLKYNINAQSPNFRQRTLSLMKKCIKRIEDSYRAYKKQDISTGDFYVIFLDSLRDLCFKSLLPGANYGRRHVALQILVWCDQIALDGYEKNLSPDVKYIKKTIVLDNTVMIVHLSVDGYEKIWRAVYVDRLLLHLEDSYESNKAFALQLLNRCPSQLLTRQKYSITLGLSDILKQASSLKPTDCVSAAYKLDLLRTKLPEKILADDTCTTPEPVSYTLLSKLHTALKDELSICAQSVVRAAVNAPMYGLLHCMVHLIARIDVNAISTSGEWRELINCIIETCISVSAGVAPVVNNSSPEGHLPMDLGGVTDHGNAGGVRLEDGRPVTAQMVLLCAWRSVKEVSLLLGEISSRLLISGEDGAEGTLAPAHMTLIGGHFTQLLTETKHRGAFEQAYVGFTKLLTRLWRCRSPDLHELPRRWLSELMCVITSGDPKGAISTTRRGAGLPFIIQALVTTELQVNGNAKCFHESMATLLRLARTPKQSNATSEKASEEDQDPTKGGRYVSDDCEEEKNIRNTAGRSETTSTLHEDNEPSKGGKKVTDVCEKETNIQNTATKSETENEPAKEGTKVTDVCEKETNIQNTANKSETENETSKDGTKVTDVCEKETNIQNTASKSETDVETRVHCLNILRALFRNTALDESVAGYVGEGLMVALEGFEGRTWMERNASTLLFSALMVRVFGVQRSRDWEKLCVRNRMTGRIFFLRYPQLYDFMLDKLKEVSENADKEILRPSLYPILLLLARLYPSSLEGTVSNLKLTAFIPYVSACASSSVLKTRQLAAKALLPLISPERYSEHVIELLRIISNKGIKRNYCHGVLLQLTRLLDAIPESFQESNVQDIGKAIKDTVWLLQQACGDNPCYLLADEWMKVINLCIWKFPKLLSNTFVIIQEYLEQLLFKTKPGPITSGREVCLSNAVYLLMIIKHYTSEQPSYKHIFLCLLHENYEATLAALNFLLILNKKHEPENDFERHLAELTDSKDFQNVKELLSSDKEYIKTLSQVLKRNANLECTQKVLEVLIMEEDTAEIIAGNKLEENSELEDEVIKDTLLNCLETEPGNLKHIYLKCYLLFMSQEELDFDLKLEVVRVLFKYSTPDNGEDCRRVVAECLTDYIHSSYFFYSHICGLTKQETLEYKASLYGTLMLLAEDDSELIRQKISKHIVQIQNTLKIITTANFHLHPELFQLDNITVVSTKSAEILIDFIKSLDRHWGIVFMVLALLDCKSEVCSGDDVGDECRVFDQNEKYNIYLEESVWAEACAEQVIRYPNECADAIDFATDYSISYEAVFEKLCGKNFQIFKDFLEDGYTKNVDFNPKVKLFYDILNKSRHANQMNTFES